MALDTVGQMLTRVRVLLQDEVEPYRYEDTELIAALNEACMEAKRLRPDLFLRTFDQSLPSFSATGDTISEDQIPSEFRPSYIYYIAGNASARDEEETQDARAAAFLNKFVSQLLTIPS